MKKITIEITDELVDTLLEKFTLDVDKDQFKRGLEIEQEHIDTVDGSIFKVAEIAVDHLNEISDYYTRLDKMEEEAKKEVGEENEELAEGDLSLYLFQNTPDEFKEVLGNSPKILTESIMKELPKESEDPIDWFESFIEDAAESFEVEKSKVSDRMIVSEIIEQVNEKLKIK